MKHQKVLSRLNRKLGNFTEEHELGNVYVAPCDVVLSDTDVVQPDLLFISRAARRRSRRPSRGCRPEPG